MDFKKIVAVITLIFFVIYLQGCYTTRQIPRETLEKHPQYHIDKIVTTEGIIIEFKLTPTVDIEKKEISGITKDKVWVDIPFSQVKMVYIKKFDVALSCLAAIGITALIAGIAFLIILATKESCPFVYSFDGTQYIFDGEPYGGAICEGLQRTDLCLLEHLRSSNGEYRLLLTNEVDETQYTDEFKLWVVDHPEGVEVIQDAANNLYTIASRQELLSVVDNKGNSWDKWLSENDLLYWDSDILLKNPDDTSGLRDTLILTFPKPENVSTAKFIAHGCNTLWGSQMLKRLVELGGDKVDLWYESQKNPALKEFRKAWRDREEIFELQVQLWVNGSWVRRGEIMGGGPFMAEERVVPLDLTGLKGDTLLIRLTPPAGFWKLNSFFIDYSQDEAIELQEISARSIIGNDGTDLSAILESSDHSYYIMPDVGQHANLTFPAPPLKPGFKRTLFAKVSGYYDMHLDATGHPQYDILNRIFTEPGFVTKFSIDEYQKWRNEQLAKASN